MKLFFKYFLLFTPTFLASLVSDQIRTVQTRTEALPYGLLYVKPNYKTNMIIIGLFLPIIFFLLGVIQHGLDLLLLKYTLVFLTFIAGLWIVSNEIVHYEIKKFAKIFFWFLFFFAIIQNTNILIVYDTQFNLLFSKGSLGQGQSYRGASLFYSEAARASFYALITYLIAYGPKIKTKLFLPVSALLIIELILIRSTSGYFMIFGFLVINFPLRIILFTFFAYLIFISYQIFPIPDFNQYKIDYLLNSLINENINTIDSIFFLDGGRIEGLMNSLKSIMAFPFGYFYSPDLFEPLGGQLAVSAPITFFRTFGIFGLLYLFFFVRSSGPGNMRAFISVFFIASIYSPNASPLVLLACIIAYKDFSVMKINYENKI